MNRAYAVVLLAAACTGAPGTSDSGTPDSGAPDSGSVADSGTPDAGPTPDSGTPDAGATPDSGTPDGGTPDSGTPRDGGCTFLICDDFEANDAGVIPAGWDFTVYPNAAGTALVDTTRAVSGTKSVKFESVQNAVFNSIVQLRHNLALPQNNFYGRMRVWFPKTPQPHHWNLIEGWGYLPNTSRTQQNEILYQYGGSVQIGSPMLPDAGHTLSAYYLSNSTDCEQSSLGWMPVQRWVCVEWQFDGTNNAARFWLDGTEVTDLAITDPRSGCGGTWTAPVFERVDLGWYNVQTENGMPMDLWVDDVAIDSARVGCQP
jgi:hypothetical protein